MPPATRDHEVIVMYLEHMAFKVGVRLRRYNLAAQVFSIVLNSDFGWIGGKFRTEIPVNDSRPSIILCHRMLAECWQGQGVHQVHICAQDPRDVIAQPDIFAPGDQKRELQPQSPMLVFIEGKAGILTIT